MALPSLTGLEQSAQAVHRHFSAGFNSGTAKRSRASAGKVASATAAYHEKKTANALLDLYEKILSLEEQLDRLRYSKYANEKLFLGELRVYKNRIRRHIGAALATYEGFDSP